MRRLLVVLVGVLVLVGAGAFGLVRAIGTGGAVSGRAVVAATPTRPAPRPTPAVLAAAATPTGTPLPPPPTSTALPAPTATPPATATPSATATPTPRPTPTPVPIPVRLGELRFSLFTVNPRFTQQAVHFTLSRPARVTVEVVASGQTRPIRTMHLGLEPAGVVHAQWDGRTDAGQLAPDGRYRYTVVARTADGATARATAAGLGITDRRIVISLSRQQLTAYTGNAVFLTTPVTTGNATELPTPTGVFPILGKYHPFTFVSPWPKGSLFYYPPSPVRYALLFDDRGYYVHDSPWRSVYGKGSNLQPGPPAGPYTGSHGCVNTPLPAMQRLFPWATIGTIVQVVP